MTQKLRIIFICFFSVSCFAQNAIKHGKQDTGFFYTQINLHGGYLENGSGADFDITNVSPNNQIAFSFFGKSKDRLQKGYVEKVKLSSYKLQMAVPFTKNTNNFGEESASFGLKLLDAWLKFDTKWDRTNFWIGNKSIPYGHNPSIDLVSNFRTNITKSDIGFAQDIGFFMKTPLTNSLDLELSVTSGGFLNTSLAKYSYTIDSSSSLRNNNNNAFVFSDQEYNDTWLLTSRIGTPTFKKYELGLIVASGNVKNFSNGFELERINRIGGDLVIKHREKFKMSNQVVFGDTWFNKMSYSTSINAQTALDYYVVNNIILSSSFLYNDFLNKDLDLDNYMSKSSITYVFSPHTRLRLNHFLSHKTSALNDKWGVLLQFVTGFGKRP